MAMACVVHETNVREMPDIRGVTLASFVTSCVCTTFSLIVSLGFLIFNISQRKHRLVRLSSPNLNLIISGGGVVSSAACLLFGLDYVYVDASTQLTAICKIRICTLVVAFSLLYLPICAKTWRIKTIFERAGYEKTVIRDSRLFSMVSVGLFVDVVVLLLWMLIDPVTAVVKEYSVQTTEKNSSIAIYTIQQCISVRHGLWISLIVVWKSLILFAALYLAWKVKNVSLPSLRDSIFIFTSVFATAMLACMTSSLTPFLQERPDAMSVIYVVCITLGSITVQIAMFLPKVYVWWNKPQRSPIRMSAVSAITDPNGNLFLEGEMETISALEHENRELKQILADKEEKILSLEDHLNSAKDKLHHMMRADSGISNMYCDEVDSSTEEEMGQLPEKGNSTAKRPNIAERIARYKVVGYPMDDPDEKAQRGSSTWRSTPKKRLRSSPSIHSTRSYTYTKEFSDLWDSLSNELSQAQSLSSNLRRSFIRNHSRSTSESSWFNDSETSQSLQSLADSLSKSYDLQTSDDAFGYINNYFHSTGLYMMNRMRKHSSSLTSSQSSLNVPGNVKPYTVPEEDSSVLRNSDHFSTSTIPGPSTPVKRLHSARVYSTLPPRRNLQRQFSDSIKRVDSPREEPPNRKTYVPFHITESFRKYLIERGPSVVSSSGESDDGKAKTSEKENNDGDDTLV